MLASSTAHHFNILFNCLAAVATKLDSDRTTIGVLQKEKTNTTWYIYAHIPYFFYSPDKSYLETNILKGYGGGAECLFNGRTAIELDIYRYNSWYNYNHPPHISNWGCEAEPIRKQKHQRKM